MPESLAFLRGQAEFFRERGLAFVFVSSPGDKLDRFAAAEGVEAFDVTMTRRISPFRDMVAVVQLWALFRRIKPVIVHSHTPKGGLLGMLAAWAARVPIRIYTIRGLPADTARGLRRLILTLSDRAACALAHRVIAVSRHIMQTATDTGWCRRDKIVMLGNGSGQGVDVARFHPRSIAEKRCVRRTLELPSDAAVIGFVGRLVPDKGVRELGDAWSYVRAKHQNAILLVVGEWEALHDPTIGRLKEAWETDPRVRVHGFDPDTPRVYSAMDVLVLPTYREGFPNVLLEAAAMALPVVASDVPGCREAVDGGITGTLVPVGEPLALANAVSNYIADSELRRAHGAAARSRVAATYDRRLVWSALAETYEQLLGEQDGLRHGPSRSLKKYVSRRV